MKEFSVALSIYIYIIQIHIKRLKIPVAFVDNVDNAAHRFP